MDFSSSREFLQVPGRKKEAAQRPEVTRRRAGSEEAGHGALMLRGGPVWGDRDRGRGSDAVRGIGVGSDAAGRPSGGSHAARGTGVGVS